jgi:hypothetical protein
VIPVGDLVWWKRISSARTNRDVIRGIMTIHEGTHHLSVAEILAVRSFTQMCYGNEMPMHLPKRKPIIPRDLSKQERSWIREILEQNPRWADVDLNDTQAVAQCDCGNCRTIYVHSSAPQNPSFAGTKGYVGRIEIITTDNFMISITLDQIDGVLSELYVDPLDLLEPGDRPLPNQWQEKVHTAIPM